MGSHSPYYVVLETFRTVVEHAILMRREPTRTFHEASGPERIFSTPMHSWTGFHLDRSFVMATPRGTRSSVRASLTSTPRLVRSSPSASQNMWNFERRPSICRI